VKSNSWAVPYAGLMTVLFAVFLALYSGAETDKKKLRSLSVSLQKALGSWFSDPVIAPEPLIAPEIEQEKKRNNIAELDLLRPM
jgi:flagellar motor protein MotB